MLIITQANVMYGQWDLSSMNLCMDKVLKPSKIAPWTGRSIPELLKNIQNQPLQFPDDKAKVSNEMKNVLRGCLQIDESKRSGWLEIIMMQPFCNSFASYLSSKK